MRNKYISMRIINLDRALRDNLDREYESRIHSPATFVFDFKVGKYPLFVMLHPQLLSLIVGIYRASARLENLREYALPGIARHWYIKKIIIDEIKITNDMENVHSTRREVKEALDSVERNGQSRNLRFSGMAAKYSSLMVHSFDALKTCGDVRKLYDDFVAEEVAAENSKDIPDGHLFRKDCVYVQDSHGRIVHEGSYPEPLIIEHMEQALAILNDGEVESLIRVAVFHYLFGYIHPFYNGNGRLSRYIASMVLSDELSALAGMRLSYVIKDHKRQYDNSFKEASDRRNMGDLTDFVENFLSYVSQSLNDMIETLESGKKAIYSIEHIIESTPELKAHEEAIRVLGLNGIFAEDYLSIDELMRYAKCGRPSAQKALDTAKAMGILTQEKQGRRYVYTIRPDVWMDLLDKNR